MKRIYCGCCCMILAYQLTIVLLALLRIPVPWYLPLEHRWLLTRNPRAVAMNFYGVTLYASLASAAGYGFGYFLLGRTPGPLTPEDAWLWLAWALAFLALAMAMIGYQIWPRPAAPVPIPPWYHPL